MWDIKNLRPLTSEQYDAARGRAIERIKARIGEKPTRKAFARELGPIASPLDWLALIVFGAALAISSVHIVQYMSKIALASYDPASAGIVIDLNLWTVVHQAGAILLAESAAILFMTMHNLRGRAGRRGIPVALLLALLASAFVFIANASSGANLLVALMPPAFTLGLGLRLEALIAEYLHRQTEISARYLAALAVFEAASADPEKHPDYSKILAQEIWQALVKISANKTFIDAPAGFKRAAVVRELDRENWSNSLEIGDADRSYGPAPENALQAVLSDSEGIPASSEDADPRPTKRRLAVNGASASAGA